MDSRDYVRMRYERRLRDGVEQEITQQKIGTFEKFTKVINKLLCICNVIKCLFFVNIRD